MNNSILKMFGISTDDLSKLEKYIKEFDEIKEQLNRIENKLDTIKRGEENG